MTDDAVTAYLAAIAGPYAAARAAADHVSLDAAERFVRTQHAALLPDGPRTAGHRFFRIVSAASGETVGHVWLHVDAGSPQAFVYDIGIDPAHRRRRYATSALTWVESIARDAGCATLALNVVADNPGAMLLYHILGFQTVSSHLSKVIRDGG
jgi:ribosomal protein S18 acetylase RimI-like enzyme